MKRFVAMSLVAVSVAACGAAGKQESRPAAAPASPPPSSAPTDAAYPAQHVEKSASPEAASSSPAGAAAPSPSPAPVAPPSPMAQPPSATAPRSDDRDARRAEGARMLAQAEGQIGSGDCGTACRALGSMERAVVFICMPNDGEDAARCDDAKGRLIDARRKVRSSCGSCPNGASVDPGAPIPSRR